MRKIYKYLKFHLKEDFQFGLYLTITLFLAGCLSTNYYFDFEDSIIDSYYGNDIRILYYFLFYGFAYYSSTLIVILFKKDHSIIKNRYFWIKSSFIILVLALDASFHYHAVLVDIYLPYPVHYWTKKVGKNLINIFTTITPLIIFYRALDKDLRNFYGLTIKGFDYKPYFHMLLIMIPLIFIASFIDNFNDFYPLYKPNAAYSYLKIPEWIPAITYELAYAWNFVTIELVFRGFMIIGLAGIMGRNVVIPMVVTYCFLHFGKPAGEAISSIIGGYVLGVIAYESRSIFGGIIIHIGIAWLMEFFAWIRFNH